MYHVVMLEFSLAGRGLSDPFFLMMVRESQADTCFQSPMLAFKGHCFETFVVLRDKDSGWEPKLWQLKKLTRNRT